MCQQDWVERWMRNKQNHDQLNWSWPLKAKKLKYSEIQKTWRATADWQLCLCISSDTTATDTEIENNTEPRGRESYSEELENCKSAGTSGHVLQLHPEKYKVMHVGHSYQTTYMME